MFLNKFTFFIFRSFSCVVALYLFLISGVSVFADSAPQFNFTPVSGGISQTGVDPGDIISGRMSINVTNDVGGDFELGFVSSSGDKLAKPGSGSPLDMSTWIELEDKVVYVGPNSSKAVNYTITVPEDASPGDYEALFTSKFLKPNEGAGASITTAIGVKYKISIAGERVYNADFKKLEYIGGVYEEGDVFNEDKLAIRVYYLVTGNSSVTPRFKVDVLDIFGKPIYSQKHEARSAYPGTSEKHKIILEKTDLANFSWWIDISASMDLVFVDADGKKDVLEGVGMKVVRVYNIPWAIVAVVGGAILLLILVFVRRWFVLGRLRRNAKIYVVKEGDTLQSVSARFSVGPKSVVLLNKLKSPFILIPGEKIMIPGSQK